METDDNKYVILLINGNVYYPNYLNYWVCLVSSVRITV